MLLIVIPEYIWKLKIKLFRLPLMWVFSLWCGITTWMFSWLMHYDININMIWLLKVFFLFNYNNKNHNPLRYLKHSPCAEYQNPVSQIRRNCLSLICEEVLDGGNAMTIPYDWYPFEWRPDLPTSAVEVVDQGNNLPFRDL